MISQVEAARPSHVFTTKKLFTDLPGLDCPATDNATFLTNFLHKPQARRKRDTARDNRPMSHRVDHADNPSVRTSCVPLH